MRKKWFSKQNPIHKLAIKFSIWIVSITAILLFLMGNIDLFSFLWGIPVFSTILEYTLLIFAYGVWFGIATILTDHGFNEGIAIPIYLMFYIVFGYLVGVLVGFIVNKLKK